MIRHDQAHGDVPAPIRVTYYHRRPQANQFSIERVFEDVRGGLPPHVEGRVAVSRFASRGLWRRLFNLVEAPFRQGQVNHISGDVHFLAFFLRKKRTLLTIHDCVLLHQRRGWARRLIRFFWYWLPEKRAAAISVISQFTRQDLLSHIRCDPAKIRVVYDPVSDRYQYAPKPFDAAKPTILQVGTGPNKNLSRLAEALRGLRCRLRIVGHPSPEARAALDANGIEYTSAANLSDDEMVREYRACDLLAFVSTYEGFGLPIVEAQATGRPVVTSQACSMPEVAGGAAVLVDPLDVSAIRTGIARVLDDAAFRADLVARGRKNVERFRARTIAAQYAAIYRDLAAPHPAPSWKGTTSCANPSC